MARYRLRFLLQEFDLPLGETLVGRGPECRVTVIDPLISRRHARIHIEEASATLEDLGSRNGSRINGEFVEGVTKLRNGDMIRVGGQELTFIETSGFLSPHRQTGFLCHCASCRVPYPKELGACPTCGSTDSAEENTVTGLDDVTRQNWALQMTLEMLAKMVGAARYPEAEKLMTQVLGSLDEKIGSGQKPDPVVLDAIGSAAVKLCAAEQNARWGLLVLATHRRAHALPSVHLLQAFQQLSGETLRLLKEDAEKLVLELYAPERDEIASVLLQIRELRSVLDKS